MNGLEEYGIRNVGYGKRVAEKDVHIVGLLRGDERVLVFANGAYIGAVNGVKPENAFNDGAQLYTSKDVDLWFDGVVRE